MENIQPEQHKEKRIQNKDNLRGWDNIKNINICIIKVLEGEEKEQEIENLFEAMMKISPNLAKEINVQVQGVPKKMNPKRPTSGHIILKMPKLKNKEIILKVVKEEQVVIYQGAPIILSANLSTEILVRKDWMKYSK